VRNPRAFLMDEPLSNLDAKLRITMRSEIKRLVSELKITTVYVTHDQTEAMALATRVGIMDKGDMVQVGTPLEIYDRPATAFVAGFIGSPPMNMFKGELGPSGTLSTTPHFLSAAVAPERLAGIRRAYPTGRPLTVGVRPEHLELEPSGARNGASAKVELIEPLGADTYVYLSCDGIEMVAVTRRIAVKVGERVGLRVLNEHIHLIDGETGRNLAGP
jgi:multiple sugar transport system ATP-binding protein